MPRHRHHFSLAVFHVGACIPRCRPHGWRRKGLQRIGFQCRILANGKCWKPLHVKKKKANPAKPASTLQALPYAIVSRLPAMLYGTGSASSPIVIDDSDDDGAGDAVPVPHSEDACRRAHTQDASHIPGINSPLPMEKTCALYGRGYSIMLRMGFEPGRGLGTKLDGVCLQLRSQCSKSYVLRAGLTEPVPPRPWIHEERVGIGSSPITRSESSKFPATIAQASEMAPSTSSPLEIDPTKRRRSTSRLDARPAKLTSGISSQQNTSGPIEASVESPRVSTSSGVVGPVNSSARALPRQNWRDGGQHVPARLHAPASAGSSRIGLPASNFAPNFIPHPGQQEVQCCDAVHSLLLILSLVLAGISDQSHLCCCNDRVSLLFQLHGSRYDVFSLYDASASLL